VFPDFGGLGPDRPRGGSNLEADRGIEPEQNQERTTPSECPAADVPEPPHPPVRYPAASDRNFDLVRAARDDSASPALSKILCSTPAVLKKPGWWGGGGRGGGVLGQDIDGL